MLKINFLRGKKGSSSVLGESRHIKGLSFRETKPPEYQHLKRGSKVQPPPLPSQPDLDMPAAKKKFSCSQLLSLERTWALVWKNFVRMSRNPSQLVFILLLPVIQVPKPYSSEKCD